MRRRLGSLAAGLLVAVAVLAGCAATPTDLSRETSTAMQTVVVSVAESAAAGDAAGALAQLDDLQLRLDAALADGSVSAERAAAIQIAIDRVRADLQPAPEPTPTVEPVPDPAVDPGVTEDDGDDGNDNSGPGNNNGNGNSGNGNGNGKDKND